MSILKYLDKNNFHHSYLIEGNKEDITPEILVFLKNIGFDTANNPDFFDINIDSLKIEDARDLKSHALEKGLSSKRIFIISANSILLEAQNTLLKMFEEPTQDTHFFLIVPDVNSIIPTLLSRFYFISTKSYFSIDTKDAEKFIKMSLKERLEFIKDFVSKNNEDEDTEIVQDSLRSLSLKFLNSLELVLQKKTLNNSSSLDSMQICFEHFFKVRKYLRMSGSSVKMLLESVAIIIPEI